MIWLTLPALASSLDIEPTPGWSVVDADDVVIMRPLGHVLTVGSVDPRVLRGALRRSVAARAEPYDIAVVFATERVHTHWSTVPAAYLGWNNLDVAGTGKPPLSNADVPFLATLWMGHPVDDDPGKDRRSWVFSQQLGSHWLGHARVELGPHPTTRLFAATPGRWSHLLNTGSSPMHGNTWTDNHDGTFTSDPSRGLGGFHDLDLYLLGLLPPEEVPEFWLIDPGPGSDVSPDRPPDALDGGPAVTISGTRIDLSVADVIAAEGSLHNGVGAHLRVLTVLLAGPSEALDSGLLPTIREHQRVWADGWAEATRERSTVTFAVKPEGFEVPAPAAPRLVPRGAW